MRIRRLLMVVAVAAALASSRATIRGGDWPTFGHDAQRSGWATDETVLNPANVGGLKLLWKVKLDNEARSMAALTAPLVADAVGPGGGRTVVYVAGSADVLYALDARDGSIVWRRRFEQHAAPRNPGMWLCPNNLNDTPVIDRSRGEIFVISSDGNFYGLDLGDGEVKYGPVQFVPPYSKNWSLNIRDGVVYTAISQGCGGARSGIYSVDVSKPLRPEVRDLWLAKAYGAGIFGRAGVAVGADGRVYASTGDGPFDPTGGEFGSSVIATDGVAMSVTDYYSPLNYQKLTKYDLDISAASVIWFPYHDFSLLAGGGKEGVLFLLNADLLGSRDHQTPLDSLKLANDDLAYEEEGIWGELSSWRDGDGNAWLYVPIWGPISKQAPAFPLTNGATPHGCIMAFRVELEPVKHQPVLKPAWVSGDFDVPEPVAIANGVVFALETGENTQQTVGTKVIYSGQKGLSDQQRAEHTHHAVLRALDAGTGKQLYESGDAITSWVHFSGLAVNKGRVYAADHDSNLYCFGLPQKAE